MRRAGLYRGRRPTGERLQWFILNHLYGVPILAGDRLGHGLAGIADSYVDDSCNLVGNGIQDGADRVGQHGRFDRGRDRLKLSSGPPGGISVDLDVWEPVAQRGEVGVEVLGKADVVDVAVVIEAPERVWSDLLGAELDRRPEQIGVNAARQWHLIAKLGHRVRLFCRRYRPFAQTLGGGSAIGRRRGALAWALRACPPFSLTGAGHSIPIGVERRARGDRPSPPCRHAAGTRAFSSNRAPLILEAPFESLRESIDTTTAAGKLQLHLFAALAEFERELIRERSQAGREVAKAAGRLGGRPLKLTAEKRTAALAMRERGEMTMGQIARALGLGRTTLYDHLDLPPLDGIPRKDAGDGLAA